MSYFYPKNTFLQLKHYIQRIYLISSVIFETISHFSRHNSSVLFSSNITYFLQKQSIKVQIFRLSTARVKVHRIPHVIFQTNSQFSSKFGSFFSVIRDNFSVLFQLKLYMLLTKVTHQSPNFQTCQCSPCHFWNQESVFLQTLQNSSLS